MLGGFKPLWPGRHGGGRSWVRASGRSVIHCSRPGSPSLSANHPLSSDPGPSDFTLLTGVYTGASEASPTYSLFRATLHGRGSHPPIQRGDWGSERQSAWPGTAGSLVSREQPRAAETGLPQGYPGLEWGRGPPSVCPARAWTGRPAGERWLGWEDSRPEHSRAWTRTEAGPAGGLRPQGERGDHTLPSAWGLCLPSLGSPPPGSGRPHEQRGRRAPRRRGRGT